MSRIDVMIKNIEELVMPTSEPYQIFVVLQNSERYNSQHSIIYESSKTIAVNESFQISSRNPLHDSIIFSLFYKTEDEKYNPIGTSRLLINKLLEPKIGEEKLPIFAFSGSVIYCGFLNISFEYFEINENKEENKFNLLQSLKFNTDYSSDSFSDSDDIPIRKKKKLRAPAAFRAAKRGKTNNSIDPDSFKPKILRKSEKYKKKDSGLKEKGSGITTDTLALLQKNKLLQKSITKLKIDPEKLKLFADYKACLNNNNETLTKARSEYRGVENGLIRNEISVTTMKSIENCCDLTQKLIDQLKKDISSESKITQQQLQNKPPISNPNLPSPKKNDK